MHSSPGRGLLQLLMPMRCAGHSADLSVYLKIQSVKKVMQVCRQASNMVALQSRVRHVKTLYNALLSQDVAGAA